MASRGLKSAVIIPLGEKGVRITKVFSHFTVQSLIGQRSFPVGVLWAELKISFQLTD